MSVEILAEMRDVLTRPETQTRFANATDETVETFLHDLAEKSIVIRSVPKAFSYSRDPDDEPYINLAAEVEADYIVSRDKDLLDLMTGYTDECKEFRRRFRPLKVISPEEFLKEFEKIRKQKLK